MIGSQVMASDPLQITMFCLLDVVDDDGIDQPHILLDIQNYNIHFEMFKTNP